MNKEFKEAMISQANRGPVIFILMNLAAVFNAKTGKIYYKSRWR